MSSAIFSLVVGTELVRVHDPNSLFAAAAAAGIPFMETATGMVWTDDGPFLRVEKTRPIRKSRKAKAKAGNKRFKGGEDMMRFPVGRPGSRERVDALVAWYTEERIKAEDSAFRD